MAFVDWAIFDGKLIKAGFNGSNGGGMVSKADNIISVELSTQVVIYSVAKFCNFALSKLKKNICVQ